MADTTSISSKKKEYRNLVNTLARGSLFLQAQRLHAAGPKQPQSSPRHIVLYLTLKKKTSTVLAQLYSP